MPKWTVETHELSAALKRMRPYSHKESGAAGWSFADSELCIEWAGMAMTLPATGSAELFVRVSAAVMKGLVRFPLPDRSSITVTVKDGRLTLDKFSVDCEVVHQPVPQLLPMLPPRLEIALLHFRQSKEAIEAAGLTEPLADIERDGAAAIARAAATLAWLGVEEGHLTEWVRAHLAALAKGEDSFPLNAPQIVLDSGGQLRLFGTR
jgi:hypothetical protein